MLPYFVSPISCHTKRCSTWVGSYFPTNIKLGWKCLSVINTLAYYATKLITAVKAFVFIAQASCCLIFSDPFHVTQKGAPLG